MHKTSISANEPAKKGIALLMVLGTIIVVITVAGAILTLMTSHTRLTHHQVSRIQAYYAAQAGMNYALEMLRTNATGWGPTSVPITKTICPAPSGCDIPNSGLPYNITVTIWPMNSDPDGSGPAISISGTAPITVTATYTYP